MKVIKWMIQHHETAPKHLIKRTITEFPNLFVGSKEANCMKAKRWWEGRMKIMQFEDSNHRLGIKVKTDKKNGKYIIHHIKSLRGRGRKRSQWVLDFYCDLLNEFERLTSAGMEMSTHILRIITIDLINNAPSSCSYDRSLLISGVPIIERITVRWLQHFMTRQNIDPRLICEKAKL